MSTLVAEATATPTTLPPGPRMPRLWQGIRFARWPCETVAVGSRRWGEGYTASSFVGPGKMVVFTDPEAIKDIFTADGDDLRSGEANAPILGPILGWHSILLLDSERHSRERRLMSPPFHGERMHVYGRLMREIADRVIDAWPVGRPFPIHHEMQAITLDVILRAVFGVDEGAAFARVRERVERFVAQANAPSAPFIALKAFQIDLGRLTPWGRFVRNRDAVRAVLLEEIARRRAEGTAGRSDILSLLVDARDEQGAPMSDEELLDEMFTLLMAGQETTATSLAWVFYHLLRHPDVLGKLRAELARVVGSGPVEAQHLPQLEYLDAVTKESARLTPVATNVMRRLHAPARIGGPDLPAGGSGAASIYGTPHPPRLSPQPEALIPQRLPRGRPRPHTLFPLRRGPPPRPGGGLP